MLFGGYIFLYEIQTYIYCLFACASIQRQLKGTRDPRPYRCYFGPCASIQNIQIYIVFVYNTYIYIHPFTLFVFKICFSLKISFGPYLLFAVGFGAPFPYNSIFELWMFNLFSNFEGHTLRSGI